MLIPVYAHFFLPNCREHCVSPVIKLTYYYDDWQTQTYKPFKMYTQGKIRKILAKLKYHLIDLSYLL